MVAILYAQNIAGQKINTYHPCDDSFFAVVVVVVVVVVVIVVVIVFVVVVVIVIVGGVGGGVGVGVCVVVSCCFHLYSRIKLM